MMDDDFSGIFDHLTPEDFHLDTSAIQEVARENKGIEAFNEFVDEQIRSLQVSYVAAQGEVRPIAILASPTVQRVFTPDGDELLNDFVARLKRESRWIGATWFFFSKKTLVGRHLVESDRVHDTNDPEVVQKAIDEGRMQVGMFWHAERREGDERHHRSGIMLPEGNGLGPSVEGPATQTVPLLADVLE